MSLDLFFRAKKSEDLIDWLTTAQTRSIIGDLRARDDHGDVMVPAALQGIPGNVYIKEFPVNRVVAVPAVLDGEGGVISPEVKDPQAWVHMRLFGDAENADFSGPHDINDIDRWEKSKMVKLVQAGGKASTHRGVSIFEITGGPNKGISIFRGHEMETTIKFHEIYGGNSY